MPSAVPKRLKGIWIQTISNFPKLLNELTQNLSTEQKNQTYREGGWTIKQVVHHCADSHMNSLVRFKLALTEDSPTIRPYFEDRWAELIDGKEDDLSDSLLLLTALHAKWTRLLNDLSEEDLNRNYIHPEHGKSISLLEAIGLYAWHCEHHLAHVKLALAEKINNKKDLPC